jgi:hypothetical protein
MTDGLVELSLISIVFDCDLVKFTLLLIFDLTTYTFYIIAGREFNFRRTHTCWRIAPENKYTVHNDAVLWISIVSIPPSHLEPEMEMTQVDFFIRFGVPEYWKDGAYYAPNQKILSSKPEAWYTNVTDTQTDTQTHRVDRRNMQNKSWMNLLKNDIKLTNFL